MNPRTRHRDVGPSGRIRRVLATLAIGTAMALWPAVGGAGERALTIVYPPEMNAFHDAAAEILRQAYAALGIDIVYRTFPAERALYSSNSGIADGELVRIAGLEREYPNLLRVPVSHVTAYQMAFTRDTGLALDGWQSLKPYRIAFHRGYKVAERNTEGIDRHLTGDDRAALLMVEHGRVAIAVANRFTGQKLIAELGLRRTVMVAKPLQADPLYHYLNNKHADLLAAVTRELRRMADAGEMVAIRRRFGLID